MRTRNFRDLLEFQWTRGNFVCLELDGDYKKIPPAVRKPFISRTIITFNVDIVGATKDLLCAYKLDTASYEAHGQDGLLALKRTIEYIHSAAPEVLVILDGNTNAGYAEAAFKRLEADAITVHPYLGGKALQPFLERTDKGIFVLCRTSNPGAFEFQDGFVGIGNQTRSELNTYSDTMPLYQYVAYRVAKRWNKNGNCGVVVGATHPQGLWEVRRIVGDMPILILDIGVQDDDVERTVAVGKDSRFRGVIINSSCGGIFDSQDTDYAEAARRETEKLRDRIRECLTEEFPARKQM